MILNRVSSDIQTLDTELPINLEDGIIYLFLVLLDVYAIFVGVESLLSLIPCTAFILIGLYLRTVYMGLSREATRLSYVTKSPIAGLISSALEGGEVIRAFELRPFFEQKMEQRVDENYLNVLLQRGLYYWFYSKVQVFHFFVLAGPLFLLLIAQLCFGSKPQDSGVNGIGDESENEGVANFIITIITFREVFFQFLEYFNNVEINLVSAERCRAYEELDMEDCYGQGVEISLKQLESQNRRISKKLLLESNIEATDRQLTTRAIEGRKKRISDSESSHSAEIIFKTGKIVVKKLTVKYPSMTKPVLKNVNFRVNACQKVAVVGRTGAGKSTLMKAIWRVIDFQEGDIVIDEIGTRSIPIKILRKNLCIVLQNTAIFKGTLLQNLTEEDYTMMPESQIAQARNDLIDLGFPRVKITENLDFGVEAMGANLSESEKQIVSMVRALQMSHLKVALLDEIGACIDEEKLAIFWRIFMTRFHQSTVLLIGHRLRSVIWYCDSVLVFDDGRLVEFGSPKTLLKKEDGNFKDIWMNG